ncbi:hypothetical protein [Haladaptatus cibarius]|uniref:hypothetical protein n=1 Tax=Haladaptatus cibarius TaxID=453847 RepID=UPI00118716A0|nr:hypothetical protein [Haladaptatus cibarius]
MVTWEIALYISDRVHYEGINNYGDGYRAQSRAKTYIEGAFEVIRNEYSNGSDYYVDILEPTETVPAPQSAIRDSFTANYPCHGIDQEISYDNLVQWFSDWTSCSTDRVRANNCTVLLTYGSTPGGGIGQTSGDKDYLHAGISAGKFLGDLPSTYNRYRSKSIDSYDAMGTVMHEIGHSLQSFNGEKDGEGDGMHHDVGFYDSSKDSLTPMGINGSINECGDPNGNRSQIELCWSECAVNHWDYDNDNDPDNI